MVRPYGSSRFSLELDDDSARRAMYLVGVDGGHFRSETIGEEVGARSTANRFPGRQKFEDITLQVGTSMAPAFWSWIRGSIENRPSRRNGAIVARDFDRRERSRRTFYDALISEIQFPAVEKDAREPAFLTVKIAPERIEFRQEGGGGTQADGDQSLWAPSRFQFHLDRFGAETMNHVSKVDAITIRQNIIMNPVGSDLKVLREVGRLEPPTLSVHVAEAFAAPWVKWWEESVGRGNRVGAEQTGALVYLTPDGVPVMSLSFAGVGITGITFDKLDRSSRAIQKVKIDLYAEEWAFEPHRPSSRTGIGSIFT